MIGVGWGKYVKMKRLLLLVALLGVVLTACDGKDDELGENKKPLPELPALPDPEDVCTAMDDIHFMAYCYRTFDVNNDGKVSVSEANAVMKIDLSDFAEKAEIVSLKGIEYFVNLQSLVCTKCAKLAALDLRYNKKMTAVESYAFSECSELCRIALPDEVVEIGWKAFGYCRKLMDVVLPNGITKIRGETFLGCSSLTSIVIPDSVTVIGDDAFRGCSSLTDIVIPDGVTEIRYGVFSGCSSLTDIAISDSVTVIGEYAFRGCSSLTSIVLPNSVTEIESAAFDGCDSLLSMTCKAIEPPSIGALWWNSYFKVPTLYVPKNSVAAYKSSNWSPLFQEIKPIE